MKKILFLLLFPLLANAQNNNFITVRQYISSNQNELIQQFVEFLSIPNIASEKNNVENANWLVKDMQKRGISNVQILNTTSNTNAPAVYGEVKVNEQANTIIFYAHYDGQPVDTTKWSQGLHPFKPVLLSGSLNQHPTVLAFTQKEYNDQWRIYARGASDDKGGIMAILNAYTALMKSGINPTVNIKFFFEGEEEAGSEHLYEILENNRQLLYADMWVICDGPVHQSGRKQIVFGVRGDTHLEITVFGSKRPLHSGHYGNWAPNPAMQLAKLLSSMKDEDGKVLIKGFYDDVIPLSNAEKIAIASIPYMDDSLKKELGFMIAEQPDKGLSESINLPSLNINGIQSANTGKLSANVIPVKAVASIDLRLVMGNDWQRQQQKVIDHIRAQGYYVTDKEPTDAERIKYPRIAMVQKSGGYNAQKTSLDNPFSKRIIAAVQNTITDKIVISPTLGGSLPLYVFEKYLHTYPITVPIANYDNNQHAENENIRLKNLWDGIETYSSIMCLGK